MQITVKQQQVLYCCTEGILRVFLLSWQQSTANDRSLANCGCMDRTGWQEKGGVHQSSALDSLSQEEMEVGAWRTAEYIDAILPSLQINSL